MVDTIQTELIFVFFQRVWTVGSANVGHELPGVKSSVSGLVDHKDS